MPKNLDVEFQILTVLSEKKPMNCKAVERATGFNDRTVRKLLKQLLRKGYLIQEERRQERGRPYYNMLTSKGKQYFSTLFVDRLNQVFRDIEHMMVVIRKPKNFQRFREFLRVTPPPLSLKPGESTFSAEDLDEHMKQVELSHSPLREAFKTIFKIYLEAWGRHPDGTVPNVVVGFTKEGYVHMIPVALLKKHGLGVGL